MTACAVCSSAGNSNAFIPFWGLIFSFGQCQGEMKYAAKLLCEIICAYYDPFCVLKFLLSAVKANEIKTMQSNSNTIFTSGHTNMYR